MTETKHMHTFGVCGQYFMLLLLTLLVSLTEASWTYKVKWPQGKVTTYAYPWTSHGDCLYDRSRDVLTCMRNHGYRSVVNTWTYDPELIVYVSVRCLTPHPSPAPFHPRYTHESVRYHTPACLCKNGEHAFHVDTTTHKGLTTENYYRCQLEALSPAMFDGLDELEVLDLSHNQLEHLDGHGFHSLPALKVLSLHHNPLRRVPEGLACLLKSLEVLDISHLQMVTFPGHAFRCDGNVTHASVLKWLNAGGSHISQVPAGSFWYLGRLQFLNMSDNLIHSLPVHPFLGAFSLKAVDLSKNLMSALPEDFCEGIPHLNELILLDNVFENFKLAILEGCGNLTRLHLGKNIIASLSGPPANLPLLKKLNLAHNRLVKLNSQIIGPRCDLRILDLSHNDLTLVNNQAFGNMVHLEELYLGGNSLHHDAFDLSRVFQNLAQLQILNLSENMLTSVNESDFAGLTSLRVLDLSHNRLASVSFAADTVLRHVTHLNLSGNTLTSLTPDAMMRLTSLQVLDLSDNLLQQVTELYVPSGLLTLDLSRNSLQGVPVLHGARGLQVLKLNWNSVTTLTERTFIGLGGLQELHLSHNILSVVHPDALAPLSDLKTLNMDYNRLAFNDSQAGEVFENMQKLEKLNLSHNVLTDVQGVFHPGSFVGLLELDVSHNPIGQVTTRLNKWNRTMHVEHVHLEGCNLREISADAFGDLIYLRTINLQNNKLTRVPVFRTHVGVIYYLQGNPITCSCHMTWLKNDVVKVMGQDIPTREYVIDVCKVIPRNFVYPVRLVDRRDFLCRTSATCPDNCTCYSQREDGDPEVVFCRDGLTSVPATLPATARVISLEGNKLGDVDVFTSSDSGALAVEELYLNSSGLTWVADYAFKNMPRLHTLDLSTNSLDRLPAHLLSTLGNLTSLALYNNDLMSLPAGLLTDVTSLQRLDLTRNFLEKLEPSTVEELRVLSDLHSVRLSSNPWKCDCSMAALYRWIKDNRTRVDDFEDMVCADRKGQFLTSVDPGLFDCQEDDDSVSVPLLVGIVVAAVIVVALSVLAYKFRFVIPAVLYSRLGIRGVRRNYQQAPLGLLYDVTVLYDQSDRKCRWWVERVLMPRLTSPQWRLRVHVPRAGETRAGESLVESAVYSVRQSASCLVLVSKYFGAHHHTVTCFHHAVNQALERPCSLVLVTWGELTKQTLECGVRQFVGRRQHLPITAPLFWDRLMYLLPTASGPNSNRRQSLISGCRFRSLSESSTTDTDIVSTKVSQPRLNEVSEHL